MLHRLFMIIGFVTILLISVFGSYNPAFVAEDNVAAPSDMCATFVTIHGYKCHEYEVLHIKWLCPPDYTICITNISSIYDFSGEY